MEIHVRLIYSMLIAFLVFTLSIFTTIIPCTMTPNTPTPESTWTMCSLNPDTCNDALGLTLKKSYFGLTTSLKSSYLITFILSFLLGFGILTLISRKFK